MAGYLSTGTLKGAIMGAALGALAGAVAQGVGSAFGSVSYAEPGKQFAKSLVHGITQGAISKAGGGRFGDGALGAFASSMGGNAIARGGLGIKQAMVAAAVGGTASVIGGGKFANGAISGAMVNMFKDQGNHNENSETGAIESKGTAGRAKQWADNLRQAIGAFGRGASSWLSRLIGTANSVGLAALEADTVAGTLPLGVRMNYEACVYASNCADTDWTILNPHLKPPNISAINQFFVDRSWTYMKPFPPPTYWADKRERP